MSTTATGAEIPARSVTLCAPEWVRFVDTWTSLEIGCSRTEVSKPKVDKTTEAPETWIFGRNDIECDYCAYCGGVARILGTVRSVSGPLLSRGVCL